MSKRKFKVGDRVRILPRKPEAKCGCFSGCVLTYRELVGDRAETVHVITNIGSAQRVVDLNGLFRGVPIKWLALDKSEPEPAPEPAPEPKPETITLELTPDEIGYLFVVVSTDTLCGRKVYAKLQAALVEDNNR